MENIPAIFCARPCDMDEPKAHQRSIYSRSWQLNIQVQIYLLSELNGALKVGMIEYPTASQVGPGLKRPAQWDCLSGRAGAVIWAQVVLLRGWHLFCCFLRWQGNLFERYYVYQDHQDFFSDTYSRRVVLCNLALFDDDDDDDEEEEEEEEDEDERTRRQQKLCSIHRRTWLGFPGSAAEGWLLWLRPASRRLDWFLWISWHRFIQTPASHRSKTCVFSCNFYSMHPSDYRFFTGETKNNFGLHGSNW